MASGAITVGDVQAFIQYARNFSMPLTQLASMMNVFQSGIASLERVLELLDTDEQSPDPPLPARPAPVDGRVVFEDVTFSYNPDVRLIEHLSLVAEPGETVAIVGPTGAGKTTLVNLIMRFYELDGGRITLDGRDIATMNRRELRSRIGMVLQDTWLFGGTIRDNIAYGRPGATEDEILAAARATYVDRFVHYLPDGYDTRDQRGGRQHQRRPEAAADDRPGVPRPAGDPHPRRGDELGRHPHRGADPGGDERAAGQPHELRDRPPPLDDPRRRRDPRDGARPDRRAGHTTPSCSPPTAPTPGSTTRSSPAPRRSSSSSDERELGQREARGRHIEAQRAVPECEHSLMTATSIELVRWTGPWADDDPDANFKADVALYTMLDPLETLGPLSAATGIPVGALVRYVLARWASAGSESLLVAGPSIIERMWAIFSDAEQTDTTEGRLAAYEVVRQMVAWLRAPLDT